MHHPLGVDTHPFECSSKLENKWTITCADVSVLVRFRDKLAISALIRVLMRATQLLVLVHLPSDLGGGRVRWIRRKQSQAENVPERSTAVRRDSYDTKFVPAYA